MLKGIPDLISPELLKILMEMGHGDTLVIGDANFPAARCARRLVRCDGHSGAQVLEAILSLLPLDADESRPVSVMTTADGSRPPIWDEYDAIISRKERPVAFAEIERFAFYEAAGSAYAVVSTGEKALYANLILKKGVL